MQKSYAFNICISLIQSILSTQAFVFCLTNVKHGKFYVHNTMFYSVISKISLNVTLIKFKG